MKRHQGSSVFHPKGSHRSSALHHHLPPSLLIQCGPALLTHTSGEGQTAITIRVLWEVYARLRLVGYSRPLCPSLVTKGGKMEEGKEEFFQSI